MLLEILLHVPKIKRRGSYVEPKPESSTNPRGRLQHPGAALRARDAEPGRVPVGVAHNKSDPVSWDTELATMTVTKEAGHGDEAEEAGAVAGAVQYTERA
jgi:hypothetical protein